MRAVHHSPSPGSVSDRPPLSSTNRHNRMSLIVVSLALITALLAFLRAWSDSLAQRKQLVEMRRWIDEAQRVLHARAHLANEVAHEIKNPITAILCSAETLDLLIGPEIEDDHRKSLQYIREYGDILLRLVSDFLDLSRTEVGQVDSAPQPIEVIPCVESIVGLLRSRAQRKEISLEIRYDDAQLHCYADPRHVKQVLFNLIYNAIKFTPEGGEVEVIVSRDAIEPCVLIEVNDTGPGIPEGLQQKIFDLYYRYESDSCDDTQLEIGTGLGLAVCKNLVELCSGKIGVQSQLGIGSSFYFTLPIHEPSDSPQVAMCSIEPAERPLLGLKFLIVDEDLGSRESVSKLIEAWGGMVDRVTMAKDALDALRINSYDAVMIDDSVASADGYSLPRTIKEDAGHPTTVIISGADAQSKGDALESGADAYVEKPFNGTVLLESLVNLEERH